jgi:metallo-beta-lactamase class B
VQPHVQRAERSAAQRWQNAERFLCGTDQTANSLNDAPLAPRWIFDDVAMLGDRGTVMYLLKTSAGFMMIDSGYAQKTQSLMLPSLKQLGIDPASIRYILITHGHPDHFGGAAYLQQHYGAKVAASSPDTQLMAAIAAKGLAAAPRVDVTLGDGAMLALGATTVRAYLVPGHTPGALGFIFPVHDHGRVHMAALFGGTVLLFNRVSDANLRQYIASLAHFASVTQAAHVSVELENHILFDDTVQKLQQLQQHPQVNPFVVGERSYQDFLRVISECSRAQLARRVPVAAPN